MHTQLRLTVLSMQGICYNMEFRGARTVRVILVILRDFFEISLVPERHAMNCISFDPPYDVFPEYVRGFAPLNGTRTIRQVQVRQTLSQLA